MNGLRHFPSTGSSSHPLCTAADILPGWQSCVWSGWGLYSKGGLGKELPPMQNTRRIDFSSRTGGSILSAGLDLNLTELISVSSPDLDLDAHLLQSHIHSFLLQISACTSATYFPFSMSHVSVKNSLSYFKAGSLSWLPSEAEKLGAVCPSSLLHLKYLSSPQILTSFLFIISCFHFSFAFATPLVQALIISQLSQTHSPCTPNLHGERSGPVFLKSCRASVPGVNTCVTLYQTNGLHIQNLLPFLPPPPREPYLIFMNKNPLLSLYYYKSFPPN